MIEINNKVKKKINNKFIKDTLTCVAKYLKIKNTEISVAFISKNEIKKLNKKYRKKNEPTDVLSFTYDSSPNKIHGEIVVCYEIARKQAKKIRYSIKKEIQKLLIHGFLHLAGYDHIKKREAEKMEKLEHDLNGIC